MLGSILLLILLPIYFVLPFVLANKFSQGYKWKFRILSFIAYLLLFELITIFGFKIIDWKPGLYLWFMFTFSIFSFLLWKSKKWYEIIIHILILNLLIIFSIEGIERLGTFIVFPDRMLTLKQLIEKYAETHNGFYPIYGDKLVFSEKEKYWYWAGDKKLTNVSYQWTQKRYKVDDNRNFMIIWEKEPSGFISRWRYVIFVGEKKPELRRTPEGKFQKLLKEQQGEIKTRRR
ncbi:MAG: hypothetical protein AB1630_07655 [bacterium]